MTPHLAFEFATATRIVFGAGKLAEGGSIAKSFGRRSLVVIGKTAGAIQRAEPLLRQLDEYATFSVAGEPSIEIVHAGVQRARGEQCDLVVSFGGGSVIDTGKAIAMLLSNGGEPLDYAEVVGRGRPITKPSAPFIAIPTTAGTGAEVTRNAVLESTEHRVKVSLRSPFMLPAVALVDPELTYDLAPEITAYTGLDALTQLIEPFVSARANPLTDAICREGMQRAARSLRIAFETGDPEARQDMCVASLFGGLALANAGLGAVHGFAGPMGGMFHAPHGALCAALLPAVLEMNGRIAPNRARFDEVRAIVGDVEELCQALKVRRLREFGIRVEDFPVIIEKAAAASSMKGNPVKLTTVQMQEILHAAW